MNRLTKLPPLLFAALLASAAMADPAPHAPGDYVFSGSIDLGAPSSWDYATYDAATGRLYIGHHDKVDVIDPAAGKVVGSMGPINGAHGAAIDAKLGRGFATSGEDGLLKEFDLADQHLIKDIPVGEDADGVIFDASTGAVILATGDSKKLVIVDAASAAVTHSVDLPGEPEVLAADGHGKVFANIASTGELSRVDIASGKLEATWPLTGCKSPHGLAYDHRTGRLFVGCANAVLLAVASSDGKILASLPVGPFNDAVVIDERRGRVFCPNGDGTLTVISEKPHDQFVVIRTIPTFIGARSMAIDPATGTLFVTYGDTQMRSGPRSPGGITFGWAGARVAILKPND